MFDFAALVATLEARLVPVLPLRAALVIEQSRFWAPPWTPSGHREVVDCSGIDVLISPKQIQDIGAFADLDLLSEPAPPNAEYCLDAHGAGGPISGSGLALPITIPAVPFSNSSQGLFAARQGS